MQTSLSRRSFLQQSTLALTSASLAYRLPRSAFGATVPSGMNEKLSVALIGIGAQGGAHLNKMVQHPGVVLTAICEADETRLSAAAKIAGPRAQPYRDYRYILERDDIDAVIIATPDHWHAVQMVHACESAKHVYVEKPACCTIAEGLAMKAAARRYNRVVQVGSQGRATEAGYQAHRYIANGMLGRIQRVECWHPRFKPDQKPVPDSTPPAELDWDLWLGPLRSQAYNAHVHPLNFRGLMESGGGQIRDRGAHVMSLALQFLGSDSKGPVSVEAKGTVPYSGLFDVSMDMEVVYEFKDPDWTMVWKQPGERVRFFREKEQFLAYNGAVYHGDKDKMVVWGGDGYTNVEERVSRFQLPANGVEVTKAPNWSNHDDWFEAIRTGREPIMNIDAGVAVANLCVLGNLSMLLGRKLAWDAGKSEVIGDEQATRLMTRPQRYPYQL